MSDEEDVPPLEDMSDLIHQIEALKQKPSNTSYGKPASSTAQEHPANKPVKLPSGNGTKESPQISANPKSDKPQTFGGMKKGFLFSKPKPKSDSESTPVRQTTAKEDDDIPLLKPKDPDAKQKQYQIDEVQQAMSASQSFLQNKDWLTEDLLHEVENNKTILHGLSSPHLMQALNEFQSNPQQAMEKYGNNPEVQKFFKEFCTLLGDHFTKVQPATPGLSTGASGGAMISEAQSNQADISVHSTKLVSGSKHSSTDVAIHKTKQQPADDEEQRVQQLLADPEIRAILLDPDVKSLIDMLRTDPEKAQRLLHQSDRGLQMKIRRLVDVGLLQFQR